MWLPRSAEGCRSIRSASRTFSMAPASATAIRTGSSWSGSFLPPFPSGSSVRRPSPRAFRGSWRRSSRRRAVWGMTLFAERTITALLGIATMSLASSACRGRDGDLPPRYRHMAVPGPRLASAEARRRGRALFLSHCAICHGERADGRGARREGLTSAPRDFTDATWKQRTSPRRIFFVIREGSRGTPMPAWGVLSDGDIWDLTAYLISAGEGP